MSDNNLQLDKLEALIIRDIIRELENFVVKDAYTTGKCAGLRKALMLIEDAKNQS